MLCDIILLNFLKGAEHYKARKFEEVSVGLGLLWDHCGAAMGLGQATQGDVWGWMGGTHSGSAPDPCGAVAMGQGVTQAHPLPPRCQRWTWHRPPAAPRRQPPGAWASAPGTSNPQTRALSPLATSAGHRDVGGPLAWGCPLGATQGGHRATVPRAHWDPQEAPTALPDPGAHLGCSSLLPASQCPSLHVPALPMSPGCPKP